MYLPGFPKVVEGQSLHLSDRCSLEPAPSLGQCSQPNLKASFVIKLIMITGLSSVVLLQASLEASLSLLFCFLFPYFTLICHKVGITAKALSCISDSCWSRVRSIWARWLGGDKFSVLRREHWVVQKSRRGHQRMQLGSWMSFPLAEIHLKFCI